MFLSKIWNKLINIFVTKRIKRRNSKNNLKKKSDLIMIE